MFHSKVLTPQATQEEILEHLNSFKIQALNYAVKVISGPNSQHLEPREVKSLTDIVLSLEDSIKSNSSEGSQARKIQQLLSRYSSNESGVVYHKSGIVVND